MFNKEISVDRKTWRAQNVGWDHGRDKDWLVLQRAGCSSIEELVDKCITFWTTEKRNLLAFLYSMGLREIVLDRNLRVVSEKNPACLGFTPAFFFVIRTHPFRPFHLWAEDITHEFGHLHHFQYHDHLEGHPQEEHFAELFGIRFSQLSEYRLQLRRLYADLHKSPNGLMRLQP